VDRIAMRLLRPTVEITIDPEDKQCAEDDREADLRRFEGLVHPKKMVKQIEAPIPKAYYRRALSVRLWTCRAHGCTPPVHSWVDWRAPATLGRLGSRSSDRWGLIAWSARGSCAMAHGARLESALISGTAPRRQAPPLSASSCAPYDASAEARILSR